MEPEWEGPGVATRDKGLVYVLDNFDCPDFKLLSGKCRCVVGSVPVVCRLSSTWDKCSSMFPQLTSELKCTCTCTCIG